MGKQRFDIVCLIGSLRHILVLPAAASALLAQTSRSARANVEPLAEELEASITGAVDVFVPGELEAILDLIRTKWGRLEIPVHSMAFAPKAICKADF